MRSKLRAHERRYLRASSRNASRQEATGGHFRGPQYTRLQHGPSSGNSVFVRSWAQPLGIEGQRHFHKTSWDFNGIWAAVSYRPCRMPRCERVRRREKPQRDRLSFRANPGREGCDHRSAATATVPGTRGALSTISGASGGLDRPGTSPRVGFRTPASDVAAHRKGPGGFTAGNVKQNGIDTQESLRYRLEHVLPVFLSARLWLSETKTAVDEVLTEGCRGSRETGRSAGRHAAMERAAMGPNLAQVGGSCSTNLGL